MQRGKSEDLMKPIHPVRKMTPSFPHSVFDPSHTEKLAKCMADIGLHE